MSIRGNVVANFSGSIWAAVMSLAFVPFYIRFMGVESYGIVGVYTSLVAMLAVLDLGLTQVMNREMARLSHDSNNDTQLVNTAYTLERVYWLMAIVIAGFVAVLAGPIANFWLNPQDIAREDLMRAMQMIGIVIGLRWPVSFYMGGLNGLQRQVIANVILGFFSSLQGLGALFVLWLIAPTIQAFFTWQVVVALIHVLVLKLALHRSLPSGQRGIFDNTILKNIWRFAAGMSGIALMTTVLTQLDKLVLSRVLPLKEFGYYVFASAVAAVIFRLVGPVFTAYYPRLTELVAQGKESALVTEYHQGSQLMSAAILPVGVLLVFFSSEVLEVWTFDSRLTVNASLLISVLTIGNLLNGLLHLPYSLQLAHGWTKLAFYQNLLAVIFLGPAIYFATIRWGALGAAAIWVVLNLAYLSIGNQVMHARLLKSEKWQWYLHDLGKPLLCVITLCLFARFFAAGAVGFWPTLIILLITLFLSMIAVIASSRFLRSISISYIRRVISK
ncbi:MAG: O-antigen/teichoic acid export membrane protein [Cryomorphaceae bacterium]